jgi:hypothetical protein
MTCKKTEKIGIYLSGRLTGKKRQLFEKHLKGCRRCSAELKIFSALSKTVREKESQLPKINIVNQVLQNISKSQPQIKQVRIAASPAKQQKKKKS